MGANKVKEDKVAKINFNELVSEARIAQIIEEEQQKAKNDIEISALKLRTVFKLEQMEEARRQNDEAKRREIRNEVVVDNLRLVTEVLKKYGYFSPDKFQNGCIGLLKAADTFNSEKGVPFPNYAAFCIETEVRLAFKRVNRAFESKTKGFLESLDAPAQLGNGDEIDKHETVYDPFAEQEFDAIIEDAEVDTLFYDIIIPSIETYGTRGKDMDMDLWKQLEIRYFIELSMEQSQRQRLTFTEMAKQLNTTPQNLRIRHKKVVEIVKRKCMEYGYRVVTGRSGRTQIVQQVQEGFKNEQPTKKGQKKKHKLVK